MWYNRGKIFLSEDTMENTANAPTPEELRVLTALDEAGVGYVRLTHPEASTMELCRGIGEEYGAEHCKNLFLTNKRGTRFYLLLMDAAKPYRTSEVSRKLGSTRLSFGTEEQLESVLGLRQGSVSALGMINPCARSAYEAGVLGVAIDSDLLKRERICVHPNINTSTLVLYTRDLVGFLEKSGITPVFPDI